MSGSLAQGGSTVRDRARKGRSRLRKWSYCWAGRRGLSLISVTRVSRPRAHYHGALTGVSTQLSRRSPCAEGVRVRRGRNRPGPCRRSRRGVGTRREGWGPRRGRGGRRGRAGRSGTEGSGGERGGGGGGGGAGGVTVGLLPPGSGPARFEGAGPEPAPLHCQGGNGS